MSQDTPAPGNHLLGQMSPYLPAHAHQPVDWYPWGEAAFARARREEKPIFLSIGYSACHWCHVQSQESFEDPEIARLLNAHFVCIKVDREERPDIDRIHQAAQMLLTRRGGGWPLSLFLTHQDRLPFFGGTYFPREPRHGLPGFRMLLERVAQLHRERREDLVAQGRALREAFADTGREDSEVQLTDAPLAACRQEAEARFDREWGGFGGAPKFPQAALLEWLLQCTARTRHSRKPDMKALMMVAQSLQKMAAGGLQDHLAGGFHRYSVDARWEIPHFEKMLYDNAALLALYAQAGACTQDRFLLHTAQRLGNWVLREMQAPEGAFYGSWDADSEGQEGRYYVWDREEVRGVLSPEEYEIFAPQYGLAGTPNFDGMWHLHQVEPWRKDLRVESARERLLSVRQRRVLPARDDKILTGWNALMIRALAVGARLLRRGEWEEAATRALDFLRGTVVRTEGEVRLLASGAGSPAPINACLDDYVFLADAILELQSLRFRGGELALARKLMDTVLARFEDRERGGFYFTSDDHEPLFHRPCSFHDEATPSGNAVAARVLLRLGYLLGETRYLEAAERTVRAGWSQLEQPMSHTGLLSALMELRSPVQILVLRGEEEELKVWQEALIRRYAPQRWVLVIPAGTPGLPEALEQKPPLGTEVAYVCQGNHCSLPVTSLPELLAQVVGPEEDPEY